MYLTSFLIIEALLVFLNTPPSTASNTPNPIPGSGFISVPHISIAIASAFLLWVLSSAFRDIFDNGNRYTLSQWIGIAVSFVGIPWVPPLPYEISHSTKSYDVVLPVIFWLLLAGIPCAYYFSGPKSEALNISGRWSTAISSALYLG